MMCFGGGLSAANGLVLVLRALVFGPPRACLLSGLRAFLERPWLPLDRQLDWIALTYESGTK
jgi:hypothetical protein